MKLADRLHTATVLLAVNVIFWLVITVVFMFATSGAVYRIIGTMLFLESALYAACVVGVLKKNKKLYLLSLVLTFGNAVLSVTDQVGTADIISLTLSFVTFLVLASVWKHVMK